MLFEESMCLRRMLNSQFKQISLESLALGNEASSTSHSWNSLLITGHMWCFNLVCHSGPKANQATKPTSEYTDMILFTNFPNDYHWISASLTSTGSSSWICVYVMCNHSLRLANSSYWSGAWGIFAISYNTVFKQILYSFTVIMLHLVYAFNYVSMPY